MTFPRSPGAARRTPLRLEALEGRVNPVLIAVPDAYAVAQGDSLTVTAPGGVLANDFSTLDFGAVLQATPNGQPRIVGSLRPLPANTVQLNPDGSFTLNAPSAIFDVAVNPLLQETVQLQFDYDITNANDPNEVSAGVGTVTVTLRQRDRQTFAVAPQPGQAPFVRVYEAGTGNLVRTILAYEETFLGGVRVASGDFNSDGVDDIVTVPGLGGSARVRVFDGIGGDLIFDQTFLDPNFRGGGYVAVTDVFGFNTSNIILGAGEGGGPIVTLIGTNIDPLDPIPIDTGGFGTAIRDFFAYDQGLRSGVRVAAGDFTGDGRLDVATAPGPGGGPQVKIFSGVDIINRVFLDRTPDPVSTFFGGDSADRNGVYITGANVDGGAAEIVTGTGSGPAIVRVYSGSGALKNQFGVPIERTTSSVGAIPPTDPTLPAGFSLFPGSGNLLAPAEAPNSLIGDGLSSGPQPVAPGLAGGGVTVATIDYNLDGADEIVTGAGPGNPPRVRIFTGAGVELNSFLALESDVLTGVNVG